MTLRDCTLFVQVPRELISHADSADTNAPATSAAHGVTVPDKDRPSAVTRILGLAAEPSVPGPCPVPTLCPSLPPRRIRIVIADLDEKSEESRGEYWQSLEHELIRGGYYLGAGKQDNAEDCDLSACDLSAVVETNETVCETVYC